MSRGVGLVARHSDKITLDIAATRRAGANRNRETEYPTEGMFARN